MPRPSNSTTRPGDEFLERYCIEFLYRFTPDFVRFDYLFFHKSSRNSADERRRGSLLSAIRRLDTQLLIEGVNCETDAHLARILSADFVKGSYYERADFVQSTARTASGTR